MPEQWGAPLTGAQMELLRAAGLNGRYKAVTSTSAILGPVCAADFSIRAVFFLPAVHPAYTLLEAGWLDGRNVRLWFGGDTAPDDWDGGSVLLRDGLIGVGVSWRHLDNNGDIIAYIAKDDVDVTEAHADDHQGGLVLPDDHQDTVTIAKMTEADVKRLYPHLDLNTLKDLRLIKEPTREERFWALHEPEGTTVPTHIKKWVKDALEFER